MGKNQKVIVEKKKEEKKNKWKIKLVIIYLFIFIYSFFCFFEKKKIPEYIGIYILKSLLDVIFFYAFICLFFFRHPTLAEQRNNLPVLENVNKTIAFHRHCSLTSRSTCQRSQKTIATVCSIILGLQVLFPMLFMNLCTCYN
jgi:hypothetical protein